MRRVLRHLFFLVAVMVVFGQTVSPARAAKPDRISVAYCNDCVQFHFQNDQGHADGLIIDIWRLWSKKTGIEIDFIPGTWEQTLRMVRDGEADVHAGLFFNDDRNAYLEYGSELTETETHFFVHKSLSEIKTVEGLKGLRIGVLSGDFVEGFLKEKLPPENIFGFKSYESIMSALKGGVLKVFAADTPTGLYHLQKQGLGFDFTYPINKPLYSNTWFTAAKKGNTELIKIINDGMSLIEPAEKQAIERRWSLIIIQKSPEADLEGVREKLNLSQQERKWLDENPVIRVHNEKDWPPFNFFESGRPQGFSIDYMKLLAARIGLRIDFMTGPTWDEFLGLMKSGGLDVMLNIVRTPDRETYMHYTRSYTSNPNAILSRQEKPYQRLEQLEGKTVAVTKGFFQEEILRRDFPGINLYLGADATETMKAVAFGKADAALGELAVLNHLIRREMMTGLIVSGELNLGNPEFSKLNIAVRKDWKILAGILEKGMDALDSKDLNQLRHKWSGEDEIAGPKKLQLTKQQWDWLKEHRSMRLGVDPVYPPFEFMDENNVYSGMASDYVRLVSDRLGIKMELVTGLKWAEVLDGVKNKTIDLLPAAVVSPERQEYINFSSPHMVFPIVIVTQQDFPLIAGLDDLGTNTLAQTKGYAVTQYIEDQFPEISRQPYDSPLQALLAVAAGKADATVLNLAVATYLIKTHNLANLKVAAPAGIDVPGLSFGVRKDWPEFVTILDKVLASITPEEESAIRSKWVGVKYETGTDIKLALQIGGAGAVILIVIILWNRQLSHQVAQRKKVEAALREKEAHLRIILDNIPGGIRLIDKDMNYVFFNSRYLELYEFPEGLLRVGEHYRAENIFQAERGDFGPGAPEKLTDTWLDEKPLQTEQLSWERTTTEGKTLHVNTSPTPEGGVVNIVTDITERKRAEEVLRESEERYESLTSNIPGVVYRRVLHPDGSLSYPYWSPGVKDLYEMDPEQMMTDTAAVMALIHPDDLARFHQSLRDSAQALSPWNVEFRVITKSGVKKWISGRARPHKNDNGDVIWDGILLNITLRKKAEAELEKKEAELRGLLEASPICVTITGKGGHFRYVNSRTNELTGFSERELLQMKGVDQYYDSGERAGVSETLKKQGFVRDAEVRLKRKGDVYYWSLLSIYPISYQGEACYVSWIIDITERKEAEELQSTILATIPIPIAVVGGTDTTILYCNEPMARLMDMSQENLIGTPVSEIYRNPDHRREYLGRLEKNGQVDDFECEFIDANDNVFWALVSSRRIIFHGEEAMLVAQIEITDRKQAEQELAKQTTMLEATLENMDQGISMVDGNLKAVNFNQHFIDLLDLSACDFKPGFDLAEAFRFNAKRGEYGPGDVEEQVRERMELAAKFEPHRFERVRPDGRVIEIRGNPVADGGGLVTTYTDVTDRNQAEEALAIARDEAESANRAKSAFLAAMSHEIRTPMNGVVGMIELLRETVMDSDQFRMTETIRDSAFSLLQIIDDILDFSKIEAGKLEMENIPFSVRDVLEGVAETLYPNAAHKGLRLKIFIDPKIPEWVMGDSGRVRQILFNLAGNAIKFTGSKPDSQGVVFIRAESVGSDDKGKTSVCFSVRDTGIGIDKETQAGLFEPFTQAERSTTRRFGGSGLGLSISKNLTDLMNGEISVESDLGEGSTFTVILPFEIDRAMPARDDEPDLSGVRALLVTDEDDNDDIGASYLKHKGCEVMFSDDLEASENIIMEAANNAQPIDIVLVGSTWPIDIQERVIGSIRANPEIENIRFLVLTTDRASKKGMVLPDMVIVGDYPLARSSYLFGVAMATGRASPELIEEIKNAEKMIGSSRVAPSLDEAAKSGSLILVAEDNVTNQEVILQQLNKLGYAAEMVADGKKALKAWQEGDYALLLTDCHMPEMDGYELTKAIRDAEVGTPGHIPIIAITANVLQGEGERCLALGMDDFLPKPVELYTLERTLLKWMPGTDEAAPATEDHSHEDKAPDVAAGAIDPTALVKIVGDDPALHRMLLGKFVDPARETAEQIQTAFEARSADAIGGFAHKLKSSARSIGANELADACQILETAGKHDDWKAIDELVPKLGAMMKTVEDYIGDS